MQHHRRDIDGLRALAVLPVLAFHAGFAGFAGGYIGVDVFFVISGYLISGILLRDLSRGEFSLRRFLERRARRIIPALYAVMILCIPAAWLLMLPDDFENFGASLFATSFFGNNMVLAITSGYWDLAAEFKPLLHTWSLGIEEQFYIVFPWVLLLCFKRRAGPLVLLAIAVASLAYAQWLHTANPKLAFLLLPTRAFELLAGVLLAQLEFGVRGARERTPRWLRETMVLLGIAAIGSSVLLLDGRSSVPGLAALLPVCGTMAVIWFSSDTLVCSRILTNRACVGIGLISYSLYLWHQPLLAFLRISSAEPPSVAASAAAVAVAFPLALLSWRFVERPFRSAEGFSRRQVFALTAVGAIALGAFGLFVYRSYGLAWRVAECASLDGRGGNEERRQPYSNRMDRYRGAQFTDPDKPNLLIIGNSFARDVLNAAYENNRLQGYEISFVHVSFRGEMCCFGSADRIRADVRSLIAQADLLICVMPMFDSGCWAEDTAIFRALGARRIVAIGTKNFGWNPNALLAMRGEERRGFRPRVLDEYWESNERDARLMPPGDFVDILALIADRDRTVPLLSPEGLIMSEDGEHLTRAGALHIGRLMFEHPVLRDLK